MARDGAHGPFEGVGIGRVRHPTTNQPITTLDWGQMRSGHGVAYFQHQELESAPVSTEYLILEGRDFLVESVPYLSVKPMLEKLQASVAKPDEAQWAQRVVLGRRALVAKLETKRDHKTDLAAIKPGRVSMEPAFVLDPTTLNTDTNNYTFEAQNTYYISGIVDMSGTTTM